MKQIIISLLFLFQFLSCASLGTRDKEIWGLEKKFPNGNEWYSEQGIIINTFNDVFKRFDQKQSSIIYNIDEGTIGIFFVDFIHYNRIFFRDNDRLKLIYSIDKYLEWEKIAVKNKEKLEKDIGYVSSYLLWNVKNQEMYRSLSDNISISFLSQNANRHQLVLNFPNYRSTYNQYITHSPETIYLEKKDAIKLKSLLETENIKRSISRIKNGLNKEKNKYK